ncbi:C39 family peptidase [Persicirhabdus sediminis]|uniref:C39 family peptidase n=1 Tax=Persicirhabdus sediminis TaxID=454144 RepID=A0A8J7MEE9_9BACT|nr:C39 family peptidase [Persicirhabdus sediminis]MBK1791766.1 C39 family peptidase [Persicirhabdus sediminis]
MKKNFFPSPLPAGLPSTGGEPMQVRIQLDQLYRQHDARWASCQLAGTEETIASHGCTVCATAMALSANGYALNPAQLNTQLIENDGFTKSALLIWKAISTISNGNLSVTVDDAPSHQLIDQELKRGNPVIAKVFYQKRIFHWVLITGKQGNDYLIHDPLGIGTPHDSMHEYPDGIYAVRYLTRRN